MTLDLLVLVKAEEFNQGLEEARVDNGRLVGRVDRDVAYAGRRGEDEGEVG